MKLKIFLKLTIFLIFFLLLFGVVIFLLNFPSKNELIEPRKEKENLTQREENFRWRLITTEAPWSKRDSFGSLVIEDKMCIFGGVEGKENLKPPIIYEKMNHLDDIWCTIDGKNWNLIKTNAEWGKRRSMGMVYFKGKIFLIGGLQVKNGLFQVKNDVWVSEDLENWEFLSLAPFSPREGHSVFVFQDKIWVIGGVNYYTREVTNDVWASEDGKHWIQITSNAPFSPRWDQAVEIFQGKIWLIGGMDLEGNVFKDVWVSEDGKNWELQTENPPWKERQGHALLTFQNKLWLIGRWNDKDKENDVWYTENGTEWKILPTPWEGREDFGALVFQNKIWIMGGMNNEWSWKNDVWVLEFQ